MLPSKKEFSALGNEKGRSAFLACESFQVLFLFFRGNDIVPVRLTIPNRNFEDVSGPVPLDAKGNPQPIKVVFEHRWKFSGKQE